MSDIPAIRQLFLEYQDSLGISLCFQNFQHELDTLPGYYVAPGGALFIAIDAAGTPQGCVALRPTEDPSTCEMKRLFVRPTARGTGLGRELLNTILDAARQLGYRTIRLDTIPGKMDRAIAMYRAAGFRDVPAYYNAPEVHLLFLALDLHQK